MAIIGGSRNPQSTTIAIVGCPGVGKSTLTDAILHTENKMFIVQTGVDHQYLGSTSKLDNNEVYKYLLRLLVVACQSAADTPARYRITHLHPDEIVFVYGKYFLSKGVISQDEYDLLEYLFQCLKAMMMPGTLIVYLHASAHTLKARLEGSGLLSGITENDLEHLGKLYYEWLLTLISSNIIWVNTEHLNLLCLNDVDKVIDDIIHKVISSRPDQRLCLLTIQSSEGKGYMAAHRIKGVMQPFRFTPTPAIWYSIISLRRAMDDWIFAHPDENEDIIDLPKSERYHRYLEKNKLVIRALVAREDRAIDPLNYHY